MRRAFACFLAALLLLTTAPAALAAESADAAQGIANAQDFLRFAESCSRESYSLGRRFVLLDDIDLSGLSYEPAGYFVGSFDGRGHTVTGLKPTADGSRLGLFRQIGPGGRVENLNVAGSVMPGGSRENIGGLAGVNEGTILNCRFTGDIRAVSNVGGLVGLNRGEIRESAYEGFLIGEHQVGGIAGKNEGVIAGCSSGGEINAVAVTPSAERRFDLAALSQDEFIDLANIGGIAGENTGRVADCRNRARVGYAYTGYNVGGIAGKSSGLVTGCLNSGEVQGRRDVGGVVGQLIPYAAWELSNEKLEELREAISFMQVLLGNANQNAVDLSGSLKQELQNMDGYADQALIALAELVREYGVYIDRETQRLHVPELDAYPIDTSALNYALFNMYSESGSLVRIAEETAGTVADDIQNISHQMGYIFNLLFALAGDDGGGLLRTTDLSLTEAYEHDEGAVADCRSRGTVRGEANVGGVVGSSSFELSFDMEDQLNSSSLLPSHAEQFLFAVVRACESNGEIRSRGDNAGGIVGRLDVGAVVDCVSTGQIASQGGSYVGGIAGTAQGTLARCWARSSLAGESYLGGIAGQGGDLLDCRAWVHFERGTEYLGAVAGWAEGTVSGNLYVDARPDGVDGVSRIGQAEPLALTAFLALEGAPAGFDRVTVRFVSNGKTVLTRELPFGGAIDDLPEVARLGRSYWEWEEFDRSHVYSDLEVNGNYYSPDTTLSSGEDVPLFLAEGEFYEEQSLHVLPFTPRWEGAGCLGGYTLTVNGYDGALTVRMRSEEPVSLFVSDEAGGWTGLNAVRDGRYVVFSLPNGGSFAVVQAEESSVPRLAVIGGMAALLLVLVLLRRRSRKKKKQ